MRVALFKFNHLGDNIAFLPAFQALRRYRPDWPVLLLTAPGLGELFSGASAPAELLTCDTASFNGLIRRPWSLASWAWRLRSRAPEACLVPFDQGNVAHLVSKWSGAAVRVGAYAEGVRARGLLTRVVPAPLDARPISWNWALMTSLVREIGGSGAWPEGAPRPDLSHLLRLKFPAKGDRKRVVVHAGSRLPLNRWPVELFVQVADRLSAEFDVVWLQHGSVPAAAPAQAKVVRVGSLAELASWLSSADLFLGNNSGPMHLADAIGVSGVVVSGPTARGWDPYWQPEKWTVLRDPGLACCPCERISHTTTRCMNVAHPMACMKHWTVDAVTEACRKRLSP